MFKQRKRRVEENCLKKLENTSSSSKATNSKLGKYFETRTTRTITAAL